ncbi:MAG: type II secretion system F family protein [Eubacteriaceae bacterium]
MPIYVYVAKDMEGKTIKGTFDASSKEEVLLLIREKRYIPLQIDELRESWGGDINFSFEKKVSIKDLALLCRQFATTIRSGITVVDSIDILRKQTTNKKLAGVLDLMYDDLLRGNSLSASMAKEPKVFPYLLISMIQTGEISGTLDKVMEDMAVHFEKEYKINQKVKSALTYPIVVSIVSILVVVILLTFVMPTFINMFDSFGAELPFATKLLMGISTSIRSFWYIHILIIVATVYFLKKYTSTPQGRYKLDKFKLKMILFGPLNTKVVMSRFANTLSVMLNSGIDILQSLDVVQRVVNNEYIKKDLNVVKDGVRKGFSIGKTMEESGSFPPLVYQMVEVGENSGTLDYVLEKVADFYDTEVETAVDQLTTLIEPLIIVILGIIVAFIVISMILPIFDLYNIIS